MTANADKKKNNYQRQDSNPRVRTQSGLNAPPWTNSDTLIFKCDLWGYLYNNTGYTNGAGAVSVAYIADIASSTEATPPRTKRLTTAARTAASAADPLRRRRAARFRLGYIVLPSSLAGISRRASVPYRIYAIYDPEVRARSQNIPAPDWRPVCI